MEMQEGSCDILMYLLWRQQCCLLQCLAQTGPGSCRYLSDRQQVRLKGATREERQLWQERLLLVAEPLQRILKRGQERLVVSSLGVINELIKQVDKLLADGIQRTR